MLQVNEKRMKTVPLDTVSSVKARPLLFTASTTSEEAFTTIVGACLGHADANRPAVLEGQIEGVHQMRVAFRRLRSGLKIFRPLVPREASAERVEDIRWLNGALGPARDWDVFLDEGMPPLFSHFPRKRGLALFRAKAETIRAAHRQALQQTVGDPRYAVLLQAFTDWLDRRTWRDGLSEERRAKLAEPVLDFATPLLEHTHRRVVKRGESFAELSSEERHGLRIRIKELRYALDFCASLYPAAAAKSYLSALSSLQDCLGVMNDIVVTQRLLDEAGLRTASAARQVIEGWYGCRLAVHEQLFAELWRGFGQCSRPWQD